MTTHVAVSPPPPASHSGAENSTGGTARQKQTRTPLRRRTARCAAVLAACGVLVALLTFTSQLRVTASGWSTTPSPNQQDPADSYLEAVSCTSSSFCAAVGSYYHYSVGIDQTIAEAWDGNQWRWVLTPDVESSDNSLLGVSCISSTWCVAVGSIANSTLVESWNGSTWARVASPNIGTGANQLTAVSCTSSGACSAVGKYVDAGGSSRVLSESWNGSVWALAGAVDAAAGDSLRGVSCSSSTMCVAVGDNSGASLIERWDGSIWSIVSAPNERGGDTLTSVSCASATSCMAVGRYTDPSRNLAQTWILSWNGSVWSVVPSPNVSGDDNGLAAVVCTLATACTATGAFTDPFTAKSQTLVEVWDGSAWSVAATPSPGSQFNYLNGVSCITSSACVSVGYFDDPTSGLAGTLVESSLGSVWSVTTSPDAQVEIMNRLMGVSCSSASSCVAAGFYQDNGAGADHALIASWNGSVWSIAAVPYDAHETVLTSVSCSAPGLCMAVGFYEAVLGSSASTTTFIEQETASGWARTSSPNGGSAGNQLNGVSCVSSNSCTAVGSYVSANGVAQTLVETWNGTAWSIVSSPNNGAGGNQLSAVSCVSTTFCTSVGGYTNAVGIGQTLVEAWNGSVWSIVASPNNGSTTDGLSGVSCPTTIWCAAVGTSLTTANAAQPLMESWNGSSWAVMPSPPTNATDASLAGISCVSTAECVAAGSDDNGGLRSFTLIEALNGASWSIQTSPSPGSSFDALAGVSCTSSLGCTAIGWMTDSHGYTQTLVVTGSPTSPPPTPSATPTPTPTPGKHHRHH